ncbi:MAG: phosphoribosyltransferase [Candidatus Polarisedimenticolia bacterium]
MSALFADRRDAGQQLAARLLAYAWRPDVVVVALPRGGVEVAYEVARALRAPLDVIVVRKLGVPGHPELAMGAIVSGGERVVNESVVRMLGIPPEVIDQASAREEAVLRHREALYRSGRPALSLEGKTVIVVDDGLATGSTMRAALQAIRRRHPARVVMAVPVAAPSTLEELAPLADDVECLATPEPFVAVGLWYGDFSPVSDDIVTDLLSHTPSPVQV